MTAARHARAQSLIVDSKAEAQPVAETRLLDFHVPVQQLQLYLSDRKQVQRLHGAVPI